MLQRVTDDAAYPKAPVALVTMEIRHPATDPLNDSSSAELRRLLTEHLPIERQAQDMAWGVGAGGAPAPAAERFVRYVNRDNTLAASLKNQAITIEATEYTNFERLLELVMLAIDARSKVSSIVGVERLGLRYVLEVHVPVGVDGRVEWANWIAEPRLGPQQVAPPGLTLTEWQGAAVYREAQPGRSMVVRYGPGVGQALDANYHLRRTLPVDPGPYFLLDIDSFWTPTGAIPEFDRNAVLVMFQDLYEPASTVFQDMLTPRLRDDLSNR